MHKKWAALVVVAGFLFLAVAAGCKSRQERVVEVDCKMAGASPGVMASSVAQPLMRVIATHVGQLKGVRSVSGDGETRLYVSSLESADLVEEQLRMSVMDARDRLPARASVTAVTVLPKGAAVPTVPVRLVSRLVTTVDSLMVAGYGISDGAVDEAIAKSIPEGPQRLDPLVVGQVIIGTGQGRMVRLSEIATFKTVTEPDHVVKDWP